MADLNELKPVGKLNPFAKFCCTIGNLPTSYMISLTYEEQLLWLCNYLEKTVIPAVNTNAESSSNTIEKFTRHEEGDNGVIITNQRLVKEFREIIVAIDEEIINELSKLFMGIY